jgi:hypothetical protein
MKTFHQFNELQTELIPHILSYIVTVPYEESSLQNESTLTHILPFVSKNFHTICNTIDILWMCPLQRLINQNPLWKQSLDAFVRKESLQSYPKESVFTTQNACNILQEISANKSEDQIPQTSIHARLYQHILKNYIRIEMPVFYMPDDMIQRGNPTGFFLFEPRYRRLIWDVMENLPMDFRNGRKISVENGIKHPPQFIYAHKSPLKRGVIACIVNILYCDIHRNGTANVQVVPIEYVRIEKVFEEEGHSDHLYFVKVMKLTEDEQVLVELRDIQDRFPSLSLT